MQPVGARIPRLAPMEVRFGRPLDFSRYEGLEGSAAIRRAITDEVMDAIASLSDQEYVDVYADRRKRELADGDGSAAAMGGDERESA